MPTLFRLVFFAAILVGLAYAAMFALVFFVQPNSAQMRVTVPEERLLGSPQRDQQEQRAPVQPAPRGGGTVRPIDQQPAETGDETGDGAAETDPSTGN